MDYYLSQIQSNDDAWDINWRFYVDYEQEFTKTYAQEHIIDMLLSDCHAVFRKNKDNVIDWVGYSSDETHRDNLIDDPSELFAKITNQNHTIYVILGHKVFRYLTMTLKYSDPLFYEIIDYEKIS